MKDYYERTRDIFRITERITEQFVSGQSSGMLRSLLSFLPRSRSKEEDLGEFVSREDQLHAKQPNLFQANPTLMMEAFRIAQAEKLELSPELEDLFARHVSLVTRTFQYAKEPREIFRSILSRKSKVGRVLRMMHRVDFLGRYIPEFGQLTCLVQHEFFHRYTADEHTLVCIDKLDALTKTENPKLVPYRELFEKLDDPLVLYLALLMHDTGRGVGARPHSEASALFAGRVAMRLQLSSERAQITHPSRRSSRHHVEHGAAAESGRPGDDHRVRCHRERSKESGCFNASHSGGWPGNERRGMVGLEGIARLASLLRDVAIPRRPGRVQSTNEDRTREIERGRERAVNCPMTLPRKSKPISISCRTIISVPSE